jgi:hypothetical protein
MGGHFDGLKVSAALAIGCVLFGAIGLVWLSVSLYELLCLYLNAAAAAAIVAIGFVLLPFVVLLVRAARVPKPVQIVVPVQADGNAQLVALVTEAAERMAPTTPLVAMAFAATGGMLSVHLPSAVTPLLLRIVERHGEATEDGNATSA